VGALALRERLPFTRLCGARCHPEAHILRVLDVVVCCLGSGADVIDEECPGARTTFIPNIVDEMRSAARLRASIAAPTRSILRLLSTQRMVPVKNVGLAVRCLELLPHATLICAGDGPERPKIEALARDLGVATG